MAGITHSKVSAKADGGDATLIRPTDWNAAHVFADPVDMGAVTLKAKRISYSSATNVVAGDFALSSGWGNTAAVSGVIGKDGGWEITVTCGGTGIAANPTITFTFKDGTWTSSPIGICKQEGGTGIVADLTSTMTATVWTMTWNGTPVSAATYIIRGIVVGRA